MIEPSRPTEELPYHLCSNESSHQRLLAKSDTEEQTTLRKKYNDHLRGEQHYPETEKRHKSTTRVDSRTRHADTTNPRTLSYSHLSSIDEKVNAALSKQKELASKAMYRQASHFKQQIKRMGEDLYRKSIKALKRKYERERQDLYDAYEKEVLKKRRELEELMYHYEKKYKEVVRKWKLRRDADVEKSETMVRRIRRQAQVHSKNLIEAEQTEKKLADLEEYNEAETLHKQSQELRRKAEKRSVEEAEARCEALVRQLREKHERQREVLIHRITLCKEQLQQLYDQQMRRIDLKYGIKEKQLEERHKASIRKLKKQVRTTNEGAGKSKEIASKIIRNSVMELEELKQKK